MKKHVWNVLLHQTELIQRQGGSEDYRFLPGPDLHPILLCTNNMKYNQLLWNGCDNVIVFIQQYLPELSYYITIQRFIKHYRLRIYQAKEIVTDPILINIMDGATKEFKMLMDNTNEERQQQQLYVGAKTIAIFLTNELIALVKNHVMDVLKLDEQDDSMGFSSITAKQLAIISYMLIIEECITKTMAKQ